MRHFGQTDMIFHQKDGSLEKENDPQKSSTWLKGLI